MSSISKTISPEAFFRQNVDSVTKEEFQNRYQLKDTLGSGNIGVIKQAIHVQSRRPCAIKIIKKGFIQSPETWANHGHNLETLTAEILIHACVHHPNVAQFLEALQDETNIYIVMELCVGNTLHRRTLHGAALSLSTIISIMKQLLEAVCYFQSRGIAHGDLHWSNIMIAGDVIKIVDFGRSSAADFPKLLDEYRQNRSNDISSRRPHKKRRSGGSSPKASGSSNSSPISSNSRCYWDTKSSGIVLGILLGVWKGQVRQRSEEETSKERAARKTLEQLTMRTKASRQAAPFPADRALQYVRTAARDLEQ